MTRRRIHLAALVTALVSLAGASNARAATVTIGFDDLTTYAFPVTTQYAAKGVTFGTAASHGVALADGDCGAPSLIQGSAEIPAHSAPNLVSSRYCASAAPSSFDSGTFAALSPARRSVSVYAGLLANGAAATSSTVRMVAYDAGGNQLAQTSAVVGRGARTRLSIQRASSQIAGVFFDTTTPVSKPGELVLDDLALDEPPFGPPHATISSHGVSGTVNRAAWFSAKGSIPVGDASINRYEWDFNGDGKYETICGGTDPASSHTFLTPAVTRSAFRWSTPRAASQRARPRSSTCRSARSTRRATPTRSRPARTPTPATSRTVPTASRASSSTSST